MFCCLVFYTLCRASNSRPAQVAVPNCERCQAAGLAEGQLMLFYDAGQLTALHAADSQQQSFEAVPVLLVCRMCFLPSGEPFKERYDSVYERFPSLLHTNCH